MKKLEIIKDIELMKKVGKEAIKKAFKQFKEEKERRKALEARSDVKKIRKELEEGVKLDYDKYALCSIDVLKTIIDCTGDIDKKDYLGETLLHCCSRKGYFHSVKYLLSQGAYIDSYSDAFGDTPLLASLDHMQLGVFELLLEKGADPDLSSKEEHCTTIHKIIGCPDLVKLLIKHGADIDVVDGDGYTPLDLAYKKSFIDSTKLLYDKGAKTSKYSMKDIKSQIDFAQRFDEM